MREIKFRAQNFGGYWRYSDKCKGGLAEFFYYVNPTDKRDGPILNRNTIGQFTGLKDKNGQEIYEGDIVKNTWGSSEQTGEIVMLPRGVRLQHNDSLTGEPFRSELWFDEDIEVIGNIQENPNLLR